MPSSSTSFAHYSNEIERDFNDQQVYYEDVCSFSNYLGNEDPLIYHCNQYFQFFSEEQQQLQENNANSFTERTLPDNSTAENQGYDKNKNAGYATF